MSAIVYIGVMWLILAAGVMRIIYMMIDDSMQNPWPTFGIVVGAALVWPIIVVVVGGMWIRERMLRWRG